MTFVAKTTCGARYLVEAKNPHELKEKLRELFGKSHPSVFLYGVKEKIMYYPWFGSFYKSVNSMYVQIHNINHYFFKGV